MIGAGPTVSSGAPPDSTVHLDADGLLASARALRDASRSQRREALLRGKYIAMLGGGPDAEVELFQGAAAELGARVTRVATGLSGDSADKEVSDVAGMLGRLYDAVDCNGLPAGVAQRLAGAAKVPVFERLASPAHPTARLAELLGPEAAPGENRRFVLQAALIGALS